MDEFALIDRYFRRDGGEGVVIGVGDDGALLEPPAGRRLVVVVDTLVEGVHYPERFAAEDVGYRAVAVNLSDVAAMGGTPQWMLLALTLADVDEDWLEGFASGLYAAAGEHGVALVGGDTTSGRQTVITVELIGHAHPDRVITRRGCRPGDRIYVSGTPGDAAGGLLSLTQGGGHAELESRFRRPAPRLALGEAVAGVASAGIDVSDGLAADLGHVADASGCGIMLDADELPLSHTLVEAFGRERARELALTGGDDYELALAVPPGAEAAFRDAAASCDVPVTAIGTAREGSGLRVVSRGRELAIGRPGYRHFGDGP